MSDQEKIGCVVVSIHKDKENLELRFGDQVVCLEISPLTSNKTRVVVRAPVSVEVFRRKHQEAQ